MIPFSNKISFNSRFNWMFVSFICKHVIMVIFYFISVLAQNFYNYTYSSMRVFVLFGSLYSQCAEY